MVTSEYQFKTILVDKQPDGVAVLYLNQPEQRNCITPELSQEMNIALG